MLDLGPDCPPHWPASRACQEKAGWGTGRTGDNHKGKEVGSWELGPWVALPALQSPLVSGHPRKRGCHCPQGVQGLTKPCST